MRALSPPPRRAAPPARRLTLRHAPGNRSSSGNVGSADFLESLGANIMLGAEQVTSTVVGCGFGFLFAPMFHPAMKYVGPARKVPPAPLLPLARPAQVRARARRNPPRRDTALHTSAYI